MIETRATIEFINDASGLVYAWIGNTPYYLELTNEKYKELLDKWVDFERKQEDLIVPVLYDPTGWKACLVSQ